MIQEDCPVGDATEQVQSQIAPLRRQIVCNDQGSPSSCARRWRSSPISVEHHASSVAAKLLFEGRAPAVVHQIERRVQNLLTNQVAGSAT